jgi:hypothetical protein
MTQVTLENDALRVEIDTASGCFDVLEKVTGTWWRRDPFRGSAGEVDLLDRASGTRRTFDLSSGSVEVDRNGEHEAGVRFGDVGGELSLAARLVLNGPELGVRVLGVSYDATRFELETIHYPARQFALRTFEDTGYLALPYGQGCLIPSEQFRKTPRNNFHQYDDLSWQSGGLAWGSGGGYAVVPVPGWNGMSMPWFGIANGSSAVVAILDTPDDISLDCLLNYNMQHVYDQAAEPSPLPRIASSAPRWRSQMGAFGYERRVRYVFQPNGSYVTMAKEYRRHAEAEGLLTSLRDKLEKNPAVEKLFGAVMVNLDGGYPWYLDYEASRFTWPDVAQIAQDMHDELGIDRAMICTWGSYDKLPPESLPFKAAMGTIDELEKMVRTVQDELGYLYTTYHGYPALLTHSTSWDADEATRSPSGAISGRWGGRSPRVYRRYAEQNLPETFAITGQQADYSDIVSAGLYEDHHPDHPLTRSDTKKLKVELFRYISSLGVLTGSEVASWWATPVLDYAKGGMYVGQLHFLMRYIHAPLFNLVFHDAMVTFDGTVGISRDYEYSDETLECLAYGVNPVFSFSLPYYPGLRPALQQEAAAMSEFLRSVALEELVHHEYVDDGYNVQLTRFGSGAEAVINTDTAPYELPGGTSVDGRGFVLRYADGRVQRGRISTTMSIE